MMVGIQNLANDMPNKRVGTNRRALLQFKARRQFESTQCARASSSEAAQSVPCACKKVESGQGESLQLARPGIISQQRQFPVLCRQVKTVSHEKAQKLQKGTPRT